MGQTEIAVRDRRNVSRGRKRAAAWLIASVALGSIAVPVTVVKAQQAVSYSIPAGTLDAALTRFGATSGIQVLYSASITQGHRSPGVRGNLSPQAAIGQLLSGTGLSYRFTGPNAVTISAPDSAVITGDVGDATRLETLVVTGGEYGTSTMKLPPEYAGGQVAKGSRLGLLGNNDVFDTPFNTTSYTAEIIRNQQARDVSDILANDPSVRAGYDARYGINSHFIIRGFPSFGQDVAFDGLYGLVNGRREGLSGIERVEVLKGPSALLNGLSPSQGVGGTINFIPKRATQVPITSITTEYASDAQFGARFDVGRRYGEDQEWGIRLNGSYLGGDTPVDKNSHKSGDVAVGIDYNTDVFRWSADVVHSEQNVDAPLRGYGLAAGVDVPEAPDGSNSAQQDWEFFNNEATFATTRAELDVTDNITLFGALGISQLQETGRGTIHRIINNNGDTTGTIDSSTSTDYERAWTGEVGARAEFETGSLDHKLVAVASFLNRSGDVDSGYTGSQPSVGQTVISNIFNPVDVPQLPEVSELGTKDPWYRTRNYGLAIADTVSYDDRIFVTAGVRYQRIANDDYDFSFGTPTFGTVVDVVDEGALTPAASIVVKPTDSLSLYANYIEGLSQGATAPLGTANENQRFGPFHTKQYEVGAKYDFDSFGVTAALFEIKRPSEMIDGNNVFSQDGEQRNRGLELNIFGEPLDGFRLLGGVAFTDARLTKTSGGVDQGNDAVGVPTTQVNLYGEYDLPIEGLATTARVIYTSSQWVDASNQREIPDWLRFDAGLRYKFERENGKPITLRANVENVFDNNYWASAAVGRLIPGAPRTFLLSAQFDF